LLVICASRSPLSSPGFPLSFPFSFASHLFIYASRAFSPSVSLGEIVQQILAGTHCWLRMPFNPLLLLLPGFPLCTLVFCSICRVAIAMNVVILASLAPLRFVVCV